MRTENDHNYQSRQFNKIKLYLLILKNTDLFVQIEVRVPIQHLKENDEIEQYKPVVRLEQSNVAFYLRPQSQQIKDEEILSIVSNNMLTFH